MNANLQRKQEIVEQLKDQLQSANLAVLAEYRGVNVAGMSDLRRQARESNVRVQVVKNSLARRAVEDTDYACLSDQLLGPLAIATSSDPVAAAKLVADFAKQHEPFQIQAGAMNGQLLDAANVNQLAKLPSRDELIGQLVGVTAAPIRNFLGVLNQLPTALVRTLAAVRDAKQ